MKNKTKMISQHEYQARLEQIQSGPVASMTLCHLDPNAFFEDGTLIDFPEKSLYELFEGEIITEQGLMSRGLLREVEVIYWNFWHDGDLIDVWSYSNLSDFAYHGSFMNVAEAILAIEKSHNNCLLHANETHLIA